MNPRVDYTRIPNVLPDVQKLIDAFYDEYSAELPLAGFSEDGYKILAKRYLLRDVDGAVAETPSSMLVRVACGVIAHRVKDKRRPTKALLAEAREYYDMMASLTFLPNSPTLMNAGTKMGQLSACFVVPVEDDMSGIFMSVHNVALIHQSGGGTGMDFSGLRPKGSFIGSTGGEASGPVSFMRAFDQATDVIKQGGKRRGANMGMLRCDHPDIMEFISAKDMDIELINKIREIFPEFQAPFENFNLSVAITDEFMEALDGEGGDGAYPLRNPQTGEVVDWLVAKDVWDILVDHAWIGGDPGVVFIDKINDANPFDIQKYPEHIMHATNPCGEQPLEGYEACNLGSINLNKFVEGSDGWKAPEFKETVFRAVKFLNDVVDSNRFPLQTIDDKVRANRKIGLGVMGLADVLMHYGFTYGGVDGIRFTNDIMSQFNAFAHEASEKLAKDEGTFPTFAHAREGMKPRRNATLTTIAPTGTIGMLAMASGGIEPVFALSQIKTVMDGEEFRTVHPILDEMLRCEELTQEEYDQIRSSGQPTPDVLTRYPELQTAYTVDPMGHLRMQAAVQDNVDNAVSKTINLPNSATREDIDKIYREAYRLNCKGVTVYRDGSKWGQVLTTGDSKAEPAASVEPVNITEAAMNAIEQLGCIACPHATPEPEIAPRPEVLAGLNIKTDTGCGSLYVTISEDENGRPIEVFTRLGKGGNCAAASAEVVGRLASNMLRSGQPVERVIKALINVSCGRQCGLGPKKNLSCYDAMGQVLKNYNEGVYHRSIIDEEELGDLIDVIEKVESPVYVPAAGACPECGGSLQQLEGCMSCPTCGYSKCS